MFSGISWNVIDFELFSTFFCFFLRSDSRISHSLIIFVKKTKLKQINFQKSTKTTEKYANISNNVSSTWERAGGKKNKICGFYGLFLAREKTAKTVKK